MLKNGQQIVDVFSKISQGIKIIGNRKRTATAKANEKCVKLLVPKTKRKRLKTNNQLLFKCNSNFRQNNEDEEEPPTEEIKTKRSEIKSSDK